MESPRESAGDSPNGTRPPSVDRRRALLGAAGLATTALAGCLGLGASGSSGGSGTNVSSDLQCFEASGAGSVDQPLSAPIKGDPKAGVTVAAYEDFACPHCKDYALDVVPELQSEFIEQGTIRYEHHDMPVVNESSWRAASGARAVQARAGDDAFWVYAEQLFKNQDSLGEDLYSTVADEICLDGGAVSDAAMNQQYEQTVTADRKRGIRKGVEGTPTVFVNGNAVDATFDAISSAIESAL